MKLIFVHDGPLFYDEESNYYEFTYHELLERYKYLADDISFLIRTKPVTSNRKYTLVPKAINIISVPDFKNPKNMKNRKQAKQIIKQAIHETDFIVFRLQSSIAQLGLKYAKKYKKPYIVESVACPWDSYWNHSLLGKCVAPFEYLTTRKAIHDAKYVYYVTTRFLQRRYPTNGKTVCCSNVVLDPVPDYVLEERIKKIKSMKEQHRPIILGTAAALDVRYKGQEYVIRAIAELKKQGYEFVYKLAGGLTGEYENTFLTDLAISLGVVDSVVFEGSLPADLMNKYYDDIDIYIQPSKQEGLPRSVIEAMSRGCPCIGTDIAGIPELIQSDCLFKKGSVEELKKALLHILCLDLKEIAVNNFRKAGAYEKNKLEIKRRAFYDLFLTEYAVKL
jgi:glycosyltransferase involved in cell wall biosynthesis